MTNGLRQDSIVIVGGGPVGVTLALLLAEQALSLTLLEAREKGAAYPDGRALALSYGTKVVLSRLGVWDAIAEKVTAINDIHISQRGSLGRSILKAHEHDLPALGYVVSYGVLSQALDTALAKHPQVNILYESTATAIDTQAEHAVIDVEIKGASQQLNPTLAVLADGGRSLNDIAGLTREIKEYGHDALVTKVETELPHGNMAYERFTPQGPMALLPNGNQFSLVWTGPSDEIQPLLALDDQTFLTQLHDAFGDRVGAFTSASKRMTFPLRLATLKPATAPHLAVIGNAAQTMHPVAGQGFNVGIRDAWVLSQHIQQADAAGLGSETMLNAYTQARETDTKRGLLFTDFLVNTFSNDWFGLHLLRGKGLGLLDMVKPAKSYLVEKMSYGK